MPLLKNVTDIYALKIWTQAVQHNNLTLNDIIYARKQMATHLRTYTHIYTHMHTDYVAPCRQKNNPIYERSIMNNNGQ